MNFHFKSLFSILFFSLFTSNALAWTAPTTPSLKHIFSGVFSFSAGSLDFAATHGHRVSIGFIGGPLVDNKGKEFGTVLTGHGSENGIIDRNGIFNLDARLTFKFDDGDYAYVTVIGKGVFLQDNYFYMSAETNSTTHAEWNRQFILGHSTLEGTTLNFDCFFASQEDVQQAKISDEL